MVNLTPLSIEGAWLFETPSHGDDRGYLREWFKESIIQEQLGREFQVSQSNLSRSKKGVVRGIHFSTATEGLDVAAQLSSPTSMTLDGGTF